MCIRDRRALLSEAARGEGGRLFVLRDGIRWYYMEEKYPELKNLMPRDVVSRETEAVCRECGQDTAWLDLTGVDKEVPVSYTHLVAGRYMIVGLQNYICK